MKCRHPALDGKGRHVLPRVGLAPRLVVPTLAPGSTALAEFPREARGGMSAPTWTLSSAAQCHPPAIATRPRATGAAVPTAGEAVAGSAWRARDVAREPLWHLPQPAHPPGRGPSCATRRRISTIELPAHPLLMLCRNQIKDCDRDEKDLGVQLYDDMSSYKSGGLEIKWILNEYWNCTPICIWPSSSHDLLHCAPPDVNLGQLCRSAS